MITTTVGLISLFGLIGILLGKVWNVMHLGDFYPKNFIAITFILSIILMGLFWFSFAGTIQQEDTITNDGDIYTIKNGEYYSFNIYFPFVVVIFLVNSLLTVVEYITLFKPFITEKRTRIF